MPNDITTTSALQQPITDSLHYDNIWNALIVAAIVAGIGYTIYATLASELFAHLYFTSSAPSVPWIFCAAPCIQISPFLA
ncbi:MAG TPA: hypothetical protein VK663_11655 [Burkholderiales bacterium]|nr:hypothetical protein [Burkholderiales bacterium]